MKSETRAKRIAEKETRINVLQYVLEVLASNGYKYGSTYNTAENEIERLNRSLVALNREAKKASQK